MNRIEIFLAQCAVKALCENDKVHTPPTSDEVRQLLAYLVSKGLRPVIVGSVAVFHHLSAGTKDFRPTVDLDVFVDRRLPAPPSGWSRDPEAVGLDSWVSPSGGVVDFMLSGFEFPGGERYPKKISADPSSPPDYPVAGADQLLRLKLNSARDKDLHDAVVLARHLGTPELGGLNRVQKENYDLVKLLVARS